MMRFRLWLALLLLGADPIDEIMAGEQHEHPATAFWRGFAAGKRAARRIDKQALARAERWGGDL